MKVTLCVDALGPQPGGIGRYTWELCKGLNGHDAVRSLRFFGRGRLIDDPEVLLRGEGLRPVPRIFRPLRRWQAEQALRNSLVHGPNYFLPASAEGGVITVHDLSVFRYPETHPAARIRAFERQFTHSLQRSAHVITDTETVRNEVIEAFSLSPASVSAVPLGVNPRYRPRHDSELTNLLPLGLRPRGYGLCVSTLEPRKRIAELARAWSRLPARLRDEYPLVLAGGAGWENEDLHAEMARGIDAGWLRHLGFVDEDLLPSLYAGAALFLYPSIYEGFGLPPIEAMASGSPVIVADRSCLPEVCGAIPQYVDPDDDDAFTEAISASLLDTSWRERAIEAGVSWAGNYSWRKCVQQTISVYQHVINSR